MPIALVLGSINHLSQSQGGRSYQRPDGEAQSRSRLHRTHFLTHGYLPL